MKPIITRSITGFVLVALIVSALFLGKYTFFILFLAITAFSVWEFFVLSQKTNSHPQKWAGIVGAVVLFCATFFSVIFNKAVLWSIIPVILFIFISELYRKKDQALQNIGITLLGILYIAVPFSTFNYLVCNPFTQNEYSHSLLLGFFTIIWLNDTAAYLFGVNFGKNRLFERISPKKSWEGSIGGALTAICSSLLLAFFFPELTALQWAGFALTVVVLGSYGDLAESLLKRSINVKDSGKILPGHGGFLDRFDAVFLAAPGAWFYLELIRFLS